MKRLMIGTALMLEALAGQTRGQHTQITWYGQSAFRIVTPLGKVLVVDPWITNPLNPHGAQDLAALSHADLILVSHAHYDHAGNAVEIGRRTGAPLVATLDVGRALATHLGYPRSQATPKSEGNYGGELTLLGGEVKVRFVPALHSSVAAPHQADGDPYTDSHYGGGPAGFLISIQNGPVIYHTGDTDLFEEMQLLAADHVTVMLVCIGDHYTMGPARAARAVTMVRPTAVLPMHFGTDDELTGTPGEFRDALRQQHSTAKLLQAQPGDTLEF